MHTLHVPGLPLPVELGAEFIHGNAEPTFTIADAAGLLVHRLPDDHWWSRQGMLSSLGAFWQRVARVRWRIGKLRHDVSYAEFLRSQRLNPRLRALALTFAEGYNAAHADRISAMTLLASDDELEEQPTQHRIANGYDGVVAWLCAGLDPERSEIRLNTTVSAVTWRKGHLVAGTSAGELAARSAIVTIPIGVWKAPEEQPGAIRFSPALPGKRTALAKLEVGHVVKIVFRFRERFWTDANFVHTSDRWMPTWWTTAPVRSTILTGWAGGHAAEALLSEGVDAARDRALDSMATAYGMRRRDLDSLLAASWTHDWQGDPFSRGAYSYAAVGGSGANEALARPVEGTLFFAGEATSSDETGTVSGAIASGRRAAGQLLSAR